MRVLIVGASGFVGRWLSADLEAAGHTVDVLPAEVDVVDEHAVDQIISEARPDAIAHLAAVSFAPDAAADPARSFAVAVRGTLSVCQALGRLPGARTLLVTGSSEVYGLPQPADLPLRETSPLSPRTAYALSKAAQEGVALACSARLGLRTIVTRSFNHTGRGQRAEFVIPALADRIRRYASGEAGHVPVGNLDVRRDFSDVRDVARAYRLLLEAGVAGRLAGDGAVVNVCSGRSVSIREIIVELGRLAGVEPALQVDPALVRPDDAPDVRGDRALLGELTGWRPEIPLGETLRDVWHDVAERASGTRLIGPVE